ncbi:hypothetical protein BV22DRAFT_1055297 [Leucogyrophana mollusca]|uniref:Uncharacterized protein n=1 Tax=Leucogyrophana mollusca TaxID=85980 RepID=A0ACB8BWI6_9AGAM|nr:hypothetical protein BV22DRAFT_1055297 [Leucogyrophana mollusca]
MPVRSTVRRLRPQYAQTLTRCGSLSQGFGNIQRSRPPLASAVQQATSTTIEGASEVWQSCQTRFKDEAARGNFACRLCFYAYVLTCYRQTRPVDTEELRRFCNKHPALAGTAGAGLVVAGGAMVLPTAGLALAGAAGFSAAGPVAGTLATAIQSTVYGAYTCGVFSAVQSFAMTATAASAPVIIAGAAAITGGSVIVKNTIDKPAQED